MYSAVVKLQTILTKQTDKLYEQTNSQTCIHIHNNEEVHAEIQQAIGPHEDLLTIVKRPKLKWYGHVSCLSGLAKSVLLCTVKGGRRQGRQKKSGQAWSLTNPRGQWRTEKNGGN